jgi:hypothetical protein
VRTRWLLGQELNLLEGNADAVLSFNAWFYNPDYPAVNTRWNWPAFLAFSGQAEPQLYFAALDYFRFNVDEHAFRAYILADRLQFVMACVGQFQAHRLLDGKPLGFAVLVDLTHGFEDKGAGRNPRLFRGLYLRHRRYAVDLHGNAVLPARRIRANHAPVAATHPT